MTKRIFTADRFTATQHSTAEEKARFCVAYAKFILSGFPRHRFKTSFYRRLSNIFGHIAHFDETGFWEVWFATPAQQRQFVRRVHEWVPIGDPHFCWSDVERELTSWAAMNADAIDTVLTDNVRTFAEAMKAEADRRAALQSMAHQPFTAVAKSANLGGFGHRQYIMCARDGSAWKVHRIYLYPWQVGQVVSVPLTHGEPDWCSIQGVECPERIRNCPQPVEA
ncbi:MAG: hypothetical protein ACLP9L_14520 [Thermoguttaceae bacterium]